MGFYCLAFAAVYGFDFEGAIEDAEESLRLGLSPLDRLTAEAAKSVAFIMLERTEEGLPILQGIATHVKRHGFSQMMASVSGTIGAGLVISGEWSKGVKQLESLIDHYQDLAPQVAALNHLTLGDVFARMALSQGQASLGTMIKNAGFVLTTVPRAAAKARTHLEQAAESFRQHDAPLFLAWALYDLGLLAAKKKQKAEARTYLDEAKAVAASCEGAALESKIDETLASISG